MSRIDELIAQYCPDGVEFKPIGDYVAYEQPGKYIVTKEEISANGTTPVLTPGKTFKLGYTSNTKNIFPASLEKPIILFDDFTTAARWIDFPFSVKSSAVKILQPSKNHKINFKYFYYLLAQAHLVPQDHSRQWISKVSLIKFPVPPLEIQEEIVRILDKFTQLEAELEAELEARRQQYEYYRDSLLNFENMNSRLGGVQLN